MAQIKWQWVLVNARVGVVRIAAGEAPSGTPYDITHVGCAVRSDDFEYVSNKEVEFYCPHSGRSIIKPVKKGMAPVGALPPPIEVKEPVAPVAPVVVEKKVEEKKTDVADWQKPNTSSDEEKLDVRGTKARSEKIERGKPVKKQTEI